MSNGIVGMVARIGAVVIAALAAATCTQRDPGNPIDRRAVCDHWCERRGECFEPGDDVYPKADCSDTCVADETWESCDEELLEQHECFNALSCTDFVKYGAAPDAPCHDEVVETSDCSAKAGT